MFEMFKNLFAGTDNEALTGAIKNGACLVDVRTPGEFSMGSVKGAVNIPLDKVLSRLSEFKAEKSIVLFCQSGGRAGRAKSMLEEKGIRNIINGGSWHNVQACMNK